MVVLLYTSSTWASHSLGRGPISRVHRGCRLRFLASHLLRAVEVMECW